MTRPITIGALIGIILLIGVYVVYVYHPTKPSLASLSVSSAPWPVETDSLKSRLAALSLPALMQEGSALHIHQHLDIFVHGQPVAVPSGIGIHETAPSFIAPIHVHDTTGIIHVESPIVEKYTLGQFFGIWGVRLDAGCIGGYCADATNTLEFYANGTRYQGDPRDLELTPHEEIVVVYGSTAEHPTTTPSSYSFPAGY